MTKFEDLRVFQAAVELRVAIHRLTATFPKDELFGIVSQLRRAAGSIARNIAEGEGRLSFGEKRQLLSQSRGSLFEVQAELIAAQRLGYVDEARLRPVREQANAVGRMLHGLIQYIQKREKQQRASGS